MPEPEPELEPVAVEVDVSDPEPEVPPVSLDVRQGAEALATRIWGSGSLPRTQLFPGMNQHTADQYLAHAMHQNWLRVDGGRVVAGSVDR